MEPPPQPFTSLSLSAELLERYLKTQTIDSTPAILCQPPSTRPARRQQLYLSSSLLASEWDSLQTTLGRLLSLRSKLLQQRQTCQHASHPISALPPELLLLVFSFLPREQYHGATMAITQVCQAWRNLTLHDKKLWATGRVGSWLNFESIELPFSRSGPHTPFDLVIDRTYEEDAPGIHPMPVNTPKTQNIKRALRDRLRSIKWAGSIMTRGSLAEILGQRDPIGIDYISVHLPLLEEIEYDTPASSRSWVGADGIVHAHFEGLYLSGAHCPKLRRLTIIGGCLKDSSFGLPIRHELSPLRSLTIKSTWLDPQHIRYMFYSEPNLITLEFVDVKGINCPEPTPSADNQIFPENFYMRSCTDGLVASILDYAKISSAAAVIIQLCEYYNYDHKPVPWCSGSLIERGNTLITLTTLMTEQIRFAYNLTTLVLRIPHHTTQTILSTLLEHPDSTPLTKLQNLVFQALDNNYCDAGCEQCKGYGHTPSHSKNVGMLLREVLLRRISSSTVHPVKKLRYLSVPDCMMVEGLEMMTDEFYEEGCIVCVADWAHKQF